MLAAIQFPLCDCRPFLALPDNAAPLARWVGARSGQRLEFLRGIGRVDRPRSAEDRAWVDEEFFCHANRAVSLPSLEQMRLGDRPAQFIPTGAFYRLLYDGQAVAQIHVGVRHSRWAAPLRGVDQRALLLIVEDFLYLPSRAGKDSIRPLALQGAAVAQAYFRATTEHNGANQPPRIEGIVDYGNPIVIAELEPGESLEPLPGCVLDKSLVGGVEAAIFRIRTTWGPVTVCVLRAGDATPAALRNLRLCVLRLHAEREVLDLVLKQIKRGRIPTKSEKLDAYLNQATRVVAQRQKYGIAQSAVARALDGQAVQALPVRYEGIRPQILRKTKQYDDARGHLRVVNTLAADAPATPLLSAQDTIVTGAGLSEINQAELHWNTRFPRDAAANASRAIFSSIDYLLETGFETLADPGGLASIRLEHDRLSAENIPLEVSFRISADGDLLRPANKPDQAPARSIVSPPMPCVAGIGTPRFPFMVRAPHSGSIDLELAAIIKNAVRFTHSLTLRVIGLPGEAEPAQPAPDPSPALLKPTSGEPLGAVSLPAQERTQATLMVERASAEGRDWFSIQLACADWSPQVNSACDIPSINNFIIKMRETLVGLSRQYRPQTAIGPDSGDAAFAIAAPQDAMLQFAQLGFRLHQLVFGDPCEDNRWKIAIELAGLGRGAAGPAPFVQVFGSNVPIPWALIYDSRAYAFVHGNPDPKRFLREPQTAADVDPECFWGARWALYRTIRQKRCAEALNPAPGAGSLVACVNPHLDKEIQEESRLEARDGVSVVKNQKNFLRAISAAPAFVESRDQFHDFICSDDAARCQLLYFFCHAEAAHSLMPNMLATSSIFDEAAAIRLDDRYSDKKISIRWMAEAALQAMVNGGGVAGLMKTSFMLRNRPLVFMNTCSSAEGDVAYPSPFIEHFKSTWGASGFVGTDWKIPTVFADLFGRRVLDAIVRYRTPILSSFHQVISAALKMNNPFGLIYGIYASPECVLPRTGGPEETLNG